MKKNILNLALMFLSIMTVVTMTSCGGGEDDNTEPESSVLGYKYVEPCLQWNATQDEVATYMNGIAGWSLKTTYNSTVSTEIWMCSYPVTEITYIYDNGVVTTGLVNVMVVYYSNKDSELQDLISKIQTAYNCTLVRNTQEQDVLYEARDVVINGKKSTVCVRSYTTGGVGFMSANYYIQ